MKIIRLKAVLECTGLSRSTLYSMIAAGTFPKSVSLGARSVGWLTSEVDAWIAERIRQRDAATVS